MSIIDFFRAAELGAASIYHQVLALGANIIHWESDPAVQPLVEIGVAAANGMLARAGAPNAGTVIQSDVHAALKSIAAADPTVPSIGGIGKLVGLAGEVVSVIDPALAPTVKVVTSAENIIEGAAAAMEASATKPAT